MVAAVTKLENDMKAGCALSLRDANFGADIVVFVEPAGDLSEISLDLVYLTAVQVMTRR